MKYTLLSLMAITASICSCKNNDNTTKQPIETIVSKIAPVSIDQKIKNAVIYEANIRQYSPEGTFNAFTKDIPELKELGVKVLWLMPVYPISTTKSKGSLGSYYAISNYTEINPEFGTLDDFRKLINKAHDNDMLVILDWVANHTGWDHHWINEHPEYYTKDNKGNITHTIDTDWTDVADLDYNNSELRTEMKNAMLHWVKNENIDGFRCDVAGMVPTTFWKNTIAELHHTKPVFMLAEAWEPELQKNAFDMGYSWDTHHIINDIAKGKKSAADLVGHLSKIDSLYAKDDILMNFVTNHDENSWNGTIKERMGEANEAMTALTYILPGMPLIYSGQEYGMDKRLLFFEKDSIPKTKGATWQLLKKLGTLKNTNNALAGGKQKAAHSVLDTANENAFAISRNFKNKEIIYVANFSDVNISLNLNKKGTYTDYVEGREILLDSKTLTDLKPWGFQILVKE